MKSSALQTIIQNAIVKKIAEIVTELVQFAYAIGFFSELIITIIVVFLLHSHVYILMFYLIGFVFSVYLNRWMKGQVKDPRPDHPIKFLASESFTKAKPSDNFYGMPSGHSQQILYSIVYLYGTLREVCKFSVPSVPCTFEDSWIWIWICVAIGCFMILERWLFRNHTVSHLLVGAVVGVLYGLFILGLQRATLQRASLQSTAAAVPGEATTSPTPTHGQSYAT